MTFTAEQVRAAQNRWNFGKTNAVLEEYAELLDLIEASDDWTLDEVKDLLRPLTAEEESSLPPPADVLEATAVALHMDAHGHTSVTRALAALIRNPLGLFPRYQDPTPEHDRTPGLTRVETEGPLLTVAGFFATSAARTDRNGTRHPAVHIRTVAGVPGTGPEYHTLDLIVDSDIAGHLADILHDCASRAVLDVVAGDTE